MDYSRYVRQYRTFVIYLLVLGGSVAALVFGIIPLAKHSLKVYQDTQLLAVKVSQLHDKVLMLESLDEDSLRNQLLGLISAVPDNKSLPTLFSTIEGVSAKTGVSFTDLTVAAVGSLSTESAKAQSVEEKKLGVSLLPFSLGIEGQPAQLHSFLEISPAVRRFYRIRQASFGFPSETLETGSFGMDAFYAPLPTSLGEATDKLEPLSGAEQDVIAQVSAIPLFVAQAPLVTAQFPVKTDPFAP